MTDRNVRTVLESLEAAQTVLAIYGSPDGPTDPLVCYNLLVGLLENTDLIRAQIALKEDHEFVILFGEPNRTSPVIVT